MVLELLFGPGNSKHRKLKVFMLGVLFSSVAAALSLWVFESHASLVMVFLTVLACIPIVYAVFSQEEEKDKPSAKEGALLREHGKAITLFMFLFFGITLSFAAWYSFLPAQKTGELFSVQISTIANINSGVTGNAIAELDTVINIFLNNLRVFLFCILFSFVYGAGAIFVLTWNASVIGTAIGNFIRTNLAEYAVASGLAKAGAYFQIASIGVLKYAIHGIPEVFAYFAAGLAGGIISLAVIRHKPGTKEFYKVVLDSSSMVLLAFVLLFFAALLEVFVTPLFF